MTLEIFTKKLGDENVVWPIDGDEQAELAVKVLDAVQTIVDVLVDEGVSYEVGFANTMSAFTEHKAKRITISAKPMLEGGRPFSDIASIMTGFAVHEIGHTKQRELEFTTAVRDEWAGKITPARLGNIIGDMRLEETAIARYAGLRDVFIPTLIWVAEKTCPVHELTYGKTIHDRLNFVGQVLRYRQFVSFAADAETTNQLRWWQEWGDNVTAKTDNEAMLRLVREGVAHIKEGAEYEPEPKPEPGEGEAGGDAGQGEPNQGNPDDDDLTEGEEGPDEDSESNDGQDGNGEAEDGDGDEDDSDGEAEGSGDDGEADDDSETGEPNGEAGDENGEPNDGDGEAEDGEPEPEDHVLDGQLDEGETLDRETSEAPIGDGAGGSGKAITEDSDVDEGLLEEKLDKTQDDLTEGEPMEKYQRERLQVQADEERVSSRIDAGAFGKMKVKVQW